jgi:hypothetical protein
MEEVAQSIRQGSTCPRALTRSLRSSGFHIRREDLKHDRDAACECTVCSGDSPRILAQFMRFSQITSL